MKITHKPSLENYNSFGIKVKATKLIEFNQEDRFEEISKQIDDFEKLLFLGEGSNILFTEDYKACILKSTDTSINVLRQNRESIWIEVGAGLNWDEFVAYCVEKGYLGLENLSLIPGSIGSCPVQNIGAYGVEVKEFIDKVYCYDFGTKQKLIFANNECKFAYRDSIFKRNKQLFIYKVRFNLNLASELNISYSAIRDYIEINNIEIESPKDLRDTVIKLRQSKLPDHKLIGNAGSFFKNPIISKLKYEELQKTYPEMPGYLTEEGNIKVSAAWLIDQSGWKGKTIGKAGVHDKQALVLVNKGGASGKDIMDLAKKIMLDIKKNFEIEIYPEVNII